MADHGIVPIVHHHELEQGDVRVEDVVEIVQLIESTGILWTTGSSAMTHSVTEPFHGNYPKHVIHANERSSKPRHLNGKSEHEDRDVEFVLFLFFVFFFFWKNK